MKIARNASRIVPPLAHELDDLVVNGRAADQPERGPQRCAGPRTGTRRRRSRSCRAAARTRPRPGRNLDSTSSGAPYLSNTLRAKRSVVSSDSEKRTRPFSRRRPRVRPMKNQRIGQHRRADRRREHADPGRLPHCRHRAAENQHRHGRHRHAELRDQHAREHGPRAERRWNSDGKVPHGGAPGRHAAVRRGPSAPLGNGRRGTPAADPMHHGILNGFGRDRAEHAPSARASRPSVTVTCRCAGQAARRVPRSRETRRPARPRRPVRIPRTRSPAPPCSRRARHAPATRSARRTSSRPARPLEHGARMRERVAEAVDRQPVALVEHPHFDRVARVEMPDFVGADPVPRRIRAVAQQVVDRGRRGAWRAVGRTHDRIGRTVGFAK